MAVRTRRAAAASISVAVALGGAAAVAHAATGDVLYVNNATTANCSDTATGAGSATSPFCTIQAAANAAVPGDMVQIASGGYFGSVSVTTSGTVTAPIVYEPAIGASVAIQPTRGSRGPALTLSGASYVSFEGWTDPSTAGTLSIDGTAVTGSSHVTFDHLDSGFHVLGNSNNVTISRDWIGSAPGTSLAGVTLAPGSSDVKITTNMLFNAAPIIVSGASDVDITSNTTDGFFGGTAISVAESSTGVSIENNVVSSPYESNINEVDVDSSSAPGTTLDYNVVSPINDYNMPVVGVRPYAWAGVAYASAAALYQATGQAEHDSNDDALMDGGEDRTAAGPEINSANGNAPGMMPTDVGSDTCSQDPTVAVTGVGSPDYCSRGAVQLTYTSASVSAAAAPVGALSASLSSSMNQAFAGTNMLTPEPTPAVSYTIAWGDGQSQTVQGSSTAAATATMHTYPRAGTYKIIDTANLTNGTTTSTTTTFSTAGTDYVPMVPTRLLDTRSGTGGYMGRLSEGHCYALPVTGEDGIPGTATAVELNVTATDTVSNGYVAVGAQNPTFSNLNYLGGQTVANTVIAPVQPDGTIEVCVEGDANTQADIVMDAFGYFDASGTSGFAPVTPDRLLDTRNGTGAAEAMIGPNRGVSVQITGRDGIPANAAAVAVHVTAVDATGNGWIGAVPDASPAPTTSITNYFRGQTVSNTVIVPIAADGKIELYNGSPRGSVDLIADAAGYFAPGANDAYVPIAPTRVLDTRGQGSPVAAKGTFTWSMQPGLPHQIPANAIALTNITLTDETANGYITAFPAGTAVPNTSNLNYLAHQNIAGLSILSTTGSDDDASIYNGSTGTTDVILDEFGYFASS